VRDLRAMPFGNSPARRVPQPGASIQPVSADGPHFDWAQCSARRPAEAYPDELVKQSVHGERISERHWT
jgi:hypothetical protein